LSSDVYIFNASNDSALACDSISYSASKYINIFENDLATLPMFFANENDIVLVDEQPNTEFIETMQSLGFSIPHFEIKTEFLKNPFSGKYQLNALKPWGWSKATHTLFRFIKNDFKHVNACSNWNPILRELSGRQTAALVLQDILENKNYPFIDKTAIPKVITDTNSIPDLFEITKHWVLKSPWSSSGRGLMKISPERFTANEQTWAQGIINEQGFIMVEPWHNKVFDFSMLFSVSSNKISPLCFSTFKTNDKGQFIGSYIHWPQENELSKMGISNTEMETISQTIAHSLQKQNFNKYYEGWIGVDAMVVDENGTFKIHPCVEINCRYTIGHLAFALRNYCKQNVKTILRIGSLSEFNTSNKTSIALTPISKKTQFIAWLEDV